MRFSIKLTLLILLLIFLVLQIFRPERLDNLPSKSENFVQIYQAPENIRLILNNACYNCHSNHTVYPWYFNIQPVGWYLNSHITDAREALNLSEFGNYSKRRRRSKIFGMKNSIEDGTMPLMSYQIMHPEARLQDADKKLLINWLDSLQP